MKYCPECGTLLIEKPIGNEKRKQCCCGYVDWDNWVNVAVVTVALNDKKECLMIRLKGEEKGKVTFPGGYRELGETLEEAAKREFFEESGYEVNDLKLFKIYTLDEKRLVWVSFVGKVGKGAFVENSETEEAMFVSGNELPYVENIRGVLTKRLLEDVTNEVFNK